MVKQILKFSGTSTTNQLRISNFIKAEEYTGIKVFCKTSLVIIVRIEGSINGIDVDFAENYKFQNEESTSINLKVEHEYYRVAVDVPAHTNVRFSSVFCELVKENKAITFDGTYDVKGFDTLILTLFNRTRTLFPVNGTLNYQAYSSCGEVLGSHTTLTITNKNTVVRPLVNNLAFGGYFLKTNIKNRTLIHPSINPVIGLFSQDTGSQHKPIQIEVLAESVLRENEFDDSLNAIEYGKITVFNNPNNNNQEDNIPLKFVESDVFFTQMKNNIQNTRLFTMFAFLRPNDINAFYNILQTEYLDENNSPSGGFVLFLNGNNEISFGKANFQNQTVVNVDYSEGVRIAVVASHLVVNGITFANTTLYRVFINGIDEGAFIDDVLAGAGLSFKVLPLSEFNGTLINFTMFPEVLTPQDITDLEAFNVETHLFLDDIQSQTIDVRGIDQVLIRTEMSNELDEITDEFTKIHIEGLLF